MGQELGKFVGLNYRSVREFKAPKAPKQMLLRRFGAKQAKTEFVGRIYSSPNKWNHIKKIYKQRRLVVHLRY